MGKFCNYEWSIDSSRQLQSLPQSFYTTHTASPPKLGRHFVTSGIPIHHMQCEWYPEICPAGCAAPSSPMATSCHQSNILGLPGRPLATSPICLSAVPSLPHTVAFHFWKYTNLVPISRPLRQLLPTHNAPPFIFAQLQPSVHAGLSSGVSSLEMSFLSPRYTSAWPPPHPLFPWLFLKFLFL